MVARQDNRFPSAEGKADTPGAGLVINVMSSVCSLRHSVSYKLSQEQYFKAPKPGSSSAPLTSSQRSVHQYPSVRHPACSRRRCPEPSSGYPPCCKT